MRQFMPEYQESLRRLGNDRRAMFQQLSTMPGLSVFASQGNFLLVKLPPGHDGVPLRDHLLTEHGVYVRECRQQARHDEPVPAARRTPSGGRTTAADRHDAVPVLGQPARDPGDRPATTGPSTRSPA
ncbi:hypothetical protein GCM10020220_111630 [Nonomuraea rubra]